VTVSDLEVRPVARVPVDASLAEVARALLETGTDTVVVDSDPVSEVTEHDIVCALAAGAGADAPVVTVARAAPQFVSASTTAVHAANIMTASRRHSLVVIDRGRPVGVVQFSCIANALSAGTSWLGAFRIALHMENPG